MIKPHAAALSGLCLSFLLLPPCLAQAMSAEPAPIQPSQVLVARSGASVMAEAVVPVRREDGRFFVDLLLPEDAKDVAIRVEGAETAAVSVRPAMLPAAGSERSRLERERSVLEGRIRALKEQAKEMLKDPAQTAKVESLYGQAAEAEIRRDALEKMIKRLPNENATGKLATASLAGDPGAAEAKVFCSFTLPSCGWTPSYAIDCVPGKDGKGIVSVRLEADVHQHSGWDWKNAGIVLVSSGSGSAMPPALRSWQIGGEQPLFSSSLKANRADFEGGSRMRMKESDAKSVPQAEAVSGAGFAAWKPIVRELKQGTTRVLLDFEEWREPLVWLARPLNGDARVYLTAKHKFDGTDYWPAGRAHWSIEGVPAGDAPFAPAKGVAALSFGADPRVSLSAFAEPRKIGKEGFIDSKKTWEWNWTYTVRNGRDMPVRLRIERPLPESLDASVDVEHSEAPSAKVDVESKSIVWELDCGAGKSVAVKHGVKVAAPKKTHVYPVAP